MNEETVKDLFDKTGVIMEGHFLLTSGKHSGRFMQCARVLQYPQYAENISQMLAEPFANDNVETVIGPATGGVILSYETARVLGAKAIFAEPCEGRMAITRGFQVKPKERVLVVEDAVTTGGSVQKVLDLLCEIDAQVIGVSVIVDRTNGNLNFGVPTKSLVSMEIVSYEPSECPYCAKGIPLQKPKSSVTRLRDRVKY